MGTTAQERNRTRAREAVRDQMLEWGWTASYMRREFGFDRATIDDFTNGRQWPQAVTQRRIERALGWGRNTIESIERGGEVPPLRPEPPDSATSVEDSLEAAVQEEARVINEAIDRMRDASPAVRKEILDYIRYKLDHVEDSF